MSRTGGSINLEELRHKPPPPEPSRTGWIKWVVLAVLAGGVAVAWPKLRAMPVRSKQNECRNLLKELYVAEKAFYGDHAKYSTSIVDITPMTGKPERYAYFLDSTGTLLDGDKGRAPTAADTGWMAAKNKLGDHPQPSLANVLPVVRPGLSGSCPKCEVTLACAGHPDTDAFVDVWSISTETREFPGPNGIGVTVVKPGEPYAHADDVLH